MPTSQRLHKLSLRTQLWVGHWGSICRSERQRRLVEGEFAWVISSLRAVSTASADQLMHVHTSSDVTACTRI